MNTGRNIFKKRSQACFNQVCTVARERAEGTVLPARSTIDAQNTNIILKKGEETAVKELNGSQIGRQIFKLFSFLQLITNILLCIIIVGLIIIVGCLMIAGIIVVVKNLKFARCRFASLYITTILASLASLSYLT